LDTSIIIDIEKLPESDLPTDSVISTVTLAELGSGLHATADIATRAARLSRIQVVEATFDSLPFDTAAARSYTHLVGLVVAAGQNPRPRRLDLMIAATAHANELPLFTRNAKDFTALHSAVTVVAV
jgi:predicted nucleic acid-binding protein